MNLFDKQFKIRARAIIIYNGKLLVVKHRKDDSFFALPGGHLEWGEDIKTCLSREILEEFGVNPEIGRLLYIHTFIEKEIKQSVEFFFEVTNSSDFLDTQKLEKSHAFEIFEMRWISQNEDINILPKDVVQDFKNGRILSDEVRYINDLIINK